MLEVFLQGINEKKCVTVIFEAKEDGMPRTRKCIPFDYGESRRYKDGKERFHFYDLSSPDGKHNLSILPEQIHKIELLQETFNPADYVTWSPSWLIARDWGNFS